MEHRTPSLVVIVTLVVVTVTRDWAGRVAEQLADVDVRSTIMSERLVRPVDVPDAAGRRQHYAR